MVSDAVVAVRIAVLGSTGSIGRQTLDVVRSLPGHFRVIALAAGRNLRLLSAQVAEFKPQYVCYDAAAGNLSTDEPVRTMRMEEMAEYPEVDTVVIATSGKVGLLAAIAGVRAGKNVAIANKEPLVMAGEIITHEAELSDASILPIDSEHSAIWQCLRGEGGKPAQIILTASGGPFRSHTPAQLETVTPREALAHPSWSMGRKVTIDSATLMNKGLEVIEAKWLFGVPIERVRVIVHPQSIIHSMVELADGSVKAQLSPPDMRLPIQYALTYPYRLPNCTLPRLDWENLGGLTFEPPDDKKFPCLRLAIEAGKMGGAAPAALCAADEVAVEMFLAGKIRFTDIPRVVAAVLEKCQPLRHPSIEDIMSVDEWARALARSLAEAIR